jgi:HK97 family phage prohead protease
MKLLGYAAVFNSKSVDLGDFVEVIAPGAFQRTLRDGHAIYGVHHHNFADILSSTRSGSLRLSEDNQGLHFEMDLPETSLGRDIHALVARGDLAHMSFSFRVNGTAGEQWRELSNGLYERTVLDADLYEISTVANPAYKATGVHARTANNASDARKNRMLQRHMKTKLSVVK